MAQLKYTKVVACGTVAAVAGLGLAGIYLYKRRSGRRAEQKKAAAAKALVSEDKHTKNKKNVPEACGDCRRDDSKSSLSSKKDKEMSPKVGQGEESSQQASHTVESTLNNLSTNQNCNTGNGANTQDPPKIVEEPCIQVVMPTTESAPKFVDTRPDLITEDPCVIASSLSATETPPPLLSNAGNMHQVVEEPVLQAVDASKTQVMQNGYGNELIRRLSNGSMHHDMTNGMTGDMTTNGLAESPFQMDGQHPLSFDWATSVEVAEKGMMTKSLTSPTSSTHNGSVAGSDLGSEGNSDGSSFDSGRCSGGSTISNQSTSLPDEPLKYQLEFPSKFCGKLIGKQGRNIRQLKEKTKASVLLKEHPYLEELHLVIIEGLQSEIDAALSYIKDRFSSVDVTKQYKPPVLEALPLPEMSQLPLPEEIINDVYVSSVVSAAHVFVQQPTHPTFMALQGLDTCMAQVYTQQADTVPQLPRPIEVGVICAAPMMQGWYRAQVVEVYQETEECDIKFLDYGGYARFEGFGLRQIRSDFMTLPFQAVECYLINLAPLPGEMEFSETARIFVEQVSQNFASLHAKVKGYSQDGIPLIELYYADSERKVHSLNKELVNQGLVSWYEGYSDVNTDETPAAAPNEIKADELVQA